MHIKSNKKGFTLIELLVVIAIIGLLSTLAVIALGSARAKSRDAKRLSDLRQVQTALEMYYTDNNTYPTTTATAITLGSTNYKCLDSTGWHASGDCDNPYMASVPADPGTGTYTYLATVATTYTISSTLEGNMGGLNAGAISVTPSSISN